MSKAVKLADIANKLGVSTVTVSKALAGQKGVSEAVRQKIKDTAEEMGYVSLSQAREQSFAKSYNIGVLVSSKYFTHSRSFYWRMYQEVTTKALTKNCFTMLEIVSDEDEKSNKIPKLIESDQVKGFIVIGSLEEAYLEMVKKTSRLPVVYMDFYDKNDNNDAVISDNFYGMYKMTKLLCDLGHRKIAYVGTLYTTDSITDRYFGYCKALSEAGIEIKKEYIIPDRFEDTKSMDKFEIVLPAKDAPTAYACNCDLAAVKVVDILKKEGLSVPEDISVVGFDDYMFGDEMKPFLTTYAVDIKGMAKRAVKIIIDKMSGNSDKQGMSIVEGRMVIRDTAKEPAK